MSATQVPVPQVAPGWQCVPGPQAAGQMFLQLSACGSQHWPLAQLGALGSQPAPEGGWQTPLTQRYPAGQGLSEPLSQPVPPPPSWQCPPTQVWPGLHCWLSEQLLLPAAWMVTWKLTAAPPAPDCAVMSGMISGDWVARRKTCASPPLPVWVVADLP